MFYIERDFSNLQFLLGILSCQFLISMFSPYDWVVLFILTRKAVGYNRMNMRFVLRCRC